MHQPFVSPSFEVVTITLVFCRKFKTYTDLVLILTLYRPSLKNLLHCCEKTPLNADIYSMHKYRYIVDICLYKFRTFADNK